MKKWAEYGATILIVIVLLSTCAAMYTTWHDCSAAGGTTVRGLLWLECVGIHN